MTQDVLQRCRESSADAFNEFMETQKDSKLGTFSYLELTGFPAVVELEKRFLPEANLAKYEASLGEYDPASTTD